MPPRQPEEGRGVLGTLSYAAEYGPEAGSTARSRVGELYPHTGIAHCDLVLPSSTWLQGSLTRTGG